ncbi:uncharacterized protein [Clytia hemisphaerica]|uniref:V-SNARE coiled-coil homology domain-containing protein n=1 Tax=Clytia hemisphaerica TaxID=252671 RepID=A0A7M5X5L2_9CNID
MGIDTLKDTRYKRIPLLNNEDESDDDEELFERSKQAASLNSNSKIDQVKHELDGAIGVMRNNINKVLDRGDRLEDLEAKSERFEMNAFNFNNSSRKLSNRMWWQSVKSKLTLALIVIGIVIIVIVSIVMKNKK